MAKLRELEANFLRYERRMETHRFRLPDGTEEERTGLSTYYITVEKLAEAQGVQVLCPLCFAKNNGKVGTHAVICWFNNRGVTEDIAPGPGRWNPKGNGLDYLTFIPPGAVSVLLLGEGCKWHGFVANGEAL